ncbi:ATP-binding cassette domain-containing protein [Clostridium sediminicola]|uniref:ABC transporter ATP-binding protein n=1 Tax=Clostridium sediminicola TaxID=3114879 RepID=UPI0031F2155B
MLKVNSISKTFGIGTINEKLALDNISFSLEEGEFLTIIGGNGAGKSTLLNCISGVHNVDKGNIFLDSKNITYMPEYKISKEIGRVFQDPLRGTAFDMTIEENLSIALSKGRRRGLRKGIHKSDRNFLREQVALLGLGLEDRMKNKVGLLSGGQRQALTLLMATIVKPKLLHLDEHTAALDPSIAAKVLSLTKTIVKEHNICTMMITHNMNHALEYGTRTIMMNEGRIILDIKGKERENMTVDSLIEQFSKKSGTRLNNDRMLLKED